MDNKQAQHQIREIFQHPFQRANYQHFLRNLLNQIEPRDAHYTGNLIPDSFKEHVTQYWRVGKYIDPDSIEMDLLVVEVKSLSKLDRARSALRNFAVNRLKQFSKDCSLVAFYAKDDGGADWRFSYVKIEHEAHQDDRGKIKLKTELTPAKRYSYLVGVHENSHTACQQLMPLLVMDYANPRIEEIEKAFSIEKVTDEFFEQYKGLYLKLSEQLKSQPFFKKETEEENTQTVARFAKKLLGQIVFLYFLQKKGWLGVAEDGKWGDGSRRFMRDRFTQVAADGGNYYHDFLQYLFYEALAKERKNQTDPDYYGRFSCKIPFLNGGLFEAEYDDWHNLDIDLPNNLFHNDEKNKAGDVGTGILDVFDRYNFTIKEDEPLEKEVAVDPEMLGKVFENMLEITERKSKGAFYTPREIVHYMCQESLINYLDNSLNSYAKLYQTIDSDQPILFGGLTDKKGQQKLEITHQDGIKVSKEDLETLIRKGHLFVENDEAALQALQRIESGEQKTTKHKIELPESIKSSADKIDNYLASIKVCDPAIGSGAFPVGMLHEIVNARLALAPHSSNNQSIYELKRHTIRESLYGVDIDASAIDIARLRLWLSLIVDEDDYTTCKALPNLDYKIVCGNSLIGFPENWRSPNFDVIEVLKREFHDTTDQERKIKLKSQIDTEIQARMANSKQIFGYQVDFDFRFFFSEVWHNKKNGFDVVIGNPPYVFGGSSKISNLDKKYFKTFYELGNKKINLFTLFIEKGGNIIKNDAFLTFIVPNTLLRVTSYSDVRKHILTKFKINEIVDLDVGVFDKVTASIIIIGLVKSNANVINHVSVKKGLTNIIHQKINQSDFQCEGCVFDIFSDDVDRKMLDTLNDNSSNLGLMSKMIRFGVVISKNIEEVVGNIKVDDSWKPFLEGDEINAYSIKYKGRFLYYKKELLHRSRTPDVFEVPKIMVQRITGGTRPVKAAYDEQEFYNKESIINIILENNNKKSLRKDYLYVLGLLNSELINWFYAKRFTNFSKLTVNLSKEYLSQIPVKTVSKEIQSVFSTLVDYILIVNNKQLLVTKFIRDVLDGLVFELYFPDEIKATNKEILKHLGALKPINNNMTDEEKLAVIQSEFDRLYDPKHPVRNNLETLDSVEEVRIIREALKK